MAPAPARGIIAQVRMVRTTPAPGTEEAPGTTVRPGHTRHHIIPTAMDATWHLHGITRPHTTNSIPIGRATDMAINTCPLLPHALPESSFPGIAIITGIEGSLPVHPHGGGNR